MKVAVRMFVVYLLAKLEPDLYHQLLVEHIPLTLGKRNTGSVEGLLLQIECKIEHDIVFVVIFFFSFFVCI